MATDALYLDEPLLEDALKTPYFFNGRLLTQEDLSQEQLAQRTRRSALGTALGSGIAYGLEVAVDTNASAPGQIVLNIAPGLAVTPGGETLHVSELVRLRFRARPGSTDVTASTGDDFSDCATVSAASTTSTSGLYLLAIHCATGREGLAAVSGLGNDAAPCNTKYRTSGVGFRSIGLGTGVTRGDPLFRSKIAVECFGFFDAALANALVDPLNGPAPLEAPLRSSPGQAPAPGYGKIDGLRARGELANCEVPLAVVHLKDTGDLDFTDTWPVRRALVRPGLTRRWWPFGGTDGRRRAEGEAAMLCFQEHVAAALRTGTGLAGATAESLFAFLPAGGFLPVGANGFDAKTFLGAGAGAVVDADFGRIRTLVEESWLCEPIDLSTGTKPPLVYFVFPEAGGNWVFFLRRPPPALVAPLPLGSPPDSPPTGSSATQGTSTKAGSLLVVVPSAWAKAHHDFVLHLDGEGLEPISRTLAIEIVNKEQKSKPALQNTEQALRVALSLPKNDAKLAPNVLDLSTTFTDASFFFRDKLAVGTHRLFVGDSKASPEDDDVMEVQVLSGRLKTITLG